VPRSTAMSRPRSDRRLSGIESFSRWMRDEHRTGPVPVVEAPGYGTTRATTRQTPPQAPLNRGSGPPGRCESDGLKRFGRVEPSSEHTATPRPHRLAQLSGTWPDTSCLNRTIVTRLWACTNPPRRRGLKHGQPTSGAFEVGTFLTFDRCVLDRGAIRNSVTNGNDHPQRR
jgi:hypothetical protein